MTFARFVQKHEQWSIKTFGNTERTLGIVRHIKKELIEVEADPHDLVEWVDVILLGIDGYNRHGGLPKDLLPLMIAKFTENKSRIYPFPTSDDEPSEHTREGQA